MKKLVALLLCVLMASSVVAVAFAEEITLDFWVRLQDDFSDEIAAFEAENPGIKVNQVNVGKDYDDLVAKYNAGMVANEMPDVGMVGQRHGIPQMYDAGWLIPIENYMPAEEQADVLDNFWVRFTYNGVRMAVPFGSSMPVLHVNMDILHELGYETIPTTWDEIIEAARKAIKDVDGDGITDVYGITLNNDVPWYIQPMVWGMNGTMLQEDGTMKVNTPELKAVLERIAMLVRDGIMAANQHGTSKQDFVNGSVLFYLASCASRGGILSSLGEEGFEYAVSYFPSDATLDVCIGGNGLAIFKSDEAHQEAAWKLIKFLLTPESIIDTNLADGYMPFTKSQFASDLIQERMQDENWARVLDQVQYIHGQGIHPADSTVWNTLNKILSDVEANPDMDIDAALEAFQTEVDEYMMMY